MYLLCIRLLAVCCVLPRFARSHSAAPIVAGMCALSLRSFAFWEYSGRLAGFCFVWCGQTKPRNTQQQSHRLFGCYRSSSACPFRHGESPHPHALIGQALPSCGRGGKNNQAGGSQGEPLSPCLLLPPFFRQVVKASFTTWLKGSPPLSSHNGAIMRRSPLGQRNFQFKGLKGHSFV